MARTPGPWRVFTERYVEGGDLLIDVVDSSLRVICEFNGSDDELDRHLANAQAIAAVPDLLDALIKLTNEAAGFLAMSDPDTHGHTNRAVLRERIRLAQNAITKAEGH